MNNSRHNVDRKKVTREDRVLAMVREKGILRSSDLKAKNISRDILTLMCRGGRLTRLSRGLYSLPDADITENHTLAEVARRVPRAIICLLSGLRFHGLTTQIPPRVWIAVDKKARKPDVKDMALKIVRFSGKDLTHGVEEHLVENVTVRITSAAKTVADCFKYRNKIGLDIAIEALRDYRHQRKSRDDLWQAAKVCRVETVMRPYMESIT